MTEALRVAVTNATVSSPAFTQRHYRRHLWQPEQSPPREHPPSSQQQLRTSTFSNAPSTTKNSAKVGSSITNSTSNAQRRNVRD
ncbi:hypothetical protein DEO72_LG11g2287 [Vigna unguiculata]|uniref:Uncharacterized protein n=1 Tax=Vigna unguiculata TaxID=3917 RepID=A0A4D6NPM4_VIGUN|nr:hypothetical protein DEO72_LG11g2287 [Vigna unguiculata]